MNRIYLSLFLLALLYSKAHCQNAPLYTWQDHFSFQDSKLMCYYDQGLIVANKLGLLFYDSTDNSMTRFSRVNGLNDVNISAIAYSQETAYTIVAYSNGNIDLLDRNKTLYNINDIKRTAMVGDKTINAVVCRGNKAFVCCGFGIVVLDLLKREVVETYRIGPNGSNININDLCFSGDSIYAASSIGLLKAKANDPQLAFFGSWTLDSSLPGPDKEAYKIAKLNSTLIAAIQSNSQGEGQVFIKKDQAWQALNTLPTTKINSFQISANLLYISTAFAVYVVDDLGILVETISKTFGTNDFLQPQNAIAFRGQTWICDLNKGVLACSPPNSFTPQTPNGPLTNNAFKLFAQSGHLWVATGSVSSAYNNTYRQDGIPHFDGSSWNTNDENSDSLLKNASDFLGVSIDPVNPNHAFVGSWDRGLIEINNGKATTIYNSSNSAIQEVPGFANNYRVACSTFDADGNLWVGNSFAPKNLVLRKTNGEWLSFSMAASFGSPTITTISQILVASSGFKWMVRHRNGLFVYDDRGTLSNPNDDRQLALNTEAGKGGLPSNEVFCIAEDLEGEIWVGTNTGFAIIYGADNVFSSNSINANQPIIEQDGNFEKILETEVINSIAVDGANRKWMGTANSGVFLISADGTTEIAHFTKDNSPLLSNEVSSVSIEPTTGEVYFATSMGIQSYISDATQSSNSISTLQAFPNPIRPNYSGPITIRGLQKDTNLKITDINGNIIETLVSNGGEAVWQRTSSQIDNLPAGVYLLFASGPDGQEKASGKMLLLK